MMWFLRTIMTAACVLNLMISSFSFFFFGGVGEKIIVSLNYFKKTSFTPKLRRSQE